MVTIFNPLMDKHVVTKMDQMGYEYTYTFSTFTLVMMQTNLLFLEEFYLLGNNAM
jgi:hypothetical protein